MYFELSSTGSTTAIVAPAAPETEQQQQKYGYDAHTIHTHAG